MPSHDGSHLNCGMAAMLRAIKAVAHDILAGLAIIVLAVAFASVVVFSLVVLVGRIVGLV